MNHLKLGILLIVLCISLILASCNGKSEPLTIGLLPVRDADEMIEDFEQIRVYLEEKLGIPVEVMVTENYASLIDGMKNSNVDIGWYGAFSYIAAESEMELNPLVLETRKDSGVYYQSLILTHKDSGIRSIEGLEGHSFAFVDLGSTSGFVLPYALFKSRQIDYEQFFSEYYYAGSHQQVPVDILENKVDAGAISSIQFDTLINHGKIKRDDFGVIWRSKDIPGPPFVARSGLDKDIQTKFADAMVTIHKESPEGLHTFDQSIEKYIKTESKHYNTIRNIATILGKDDMYEYFLKGE